MGGGGGELDKKNTHGREGRREAESKGMQQRIIRLTEGKERGRVKNKACFACVCAIINKRKLVAF